MKDPFEAALEDQESPPQSPTAAASDDDEAPPPSTMLIDPDEVAPPPSQQQQQQQQQQEEDEDEEEEDEETASAVVAGPAKMKASLAKGKGKGKEVEEDQEEEEEDVKVQAKVSGGRGGAAGDADKMGKMQEILSKFTEEQMSRYESFRRSGFQKSNMKKLLASIIGSQKISVPMTIVVSGIAKLFVGELVETSRTVMMERKETGPVRPCHIREAYRRLKLEGKIPRRSVPRLFR